MRNVLKKALSCLLAFAMIFSLMPQLTTPARAAEYVEQINVAELANGEKRITEDGAYRLYGTYTPTSSTYNRWITVSNGVTATFDLDGVSLTGTIAPFRILGTGKVTLNLIGDNTLKCTGTSTSSGVYQSGITVSPNAELTIEGTDSDTLTVSAGYYSAAIGGYYASAAAERYSGKITINGGAVTAIGNVGNYGAYGGAAIGGASGGGNGGGITITGGTVIATASYSAGIGGGNGRDGGTITITGGTVTSTVSNGGAGIGGGISGNGGTITITGGAVRATGGSTAAGIGGGDSGDGGTITITGGNVTATGGSLASGIGGGNGRDGGNITITDGVVTATGGGGGAGIGGGNGRDGGMVTITGGTVSATGGSTAAGIGGGQSNVSSSYSTGGGGDITINGGVVTATGGTYGAGIGGGGSVATGGKSNGGASGGNITITGGVITATGGASGNYGGAGIGGGCSAYNGNGNGGIINISGGVITATGGGTTNGGAGIGGGYLGSGGTVTITGGIVKATGSVAGIGAKNGTGTNIFTSGNIEARKGDVMLITNSGAITVTNATTTTNGAAYGLYQVYCVAVTVVDADGYPVPDAEVTIPDNLEGPYTYTAVTNSSGIAYCWVPARTGVTFEAVYEDLDFGYAEKDVAANYTNAVTIVFGMRAAVTKTPSERVLKANATSTPVTLNVKTENLTGLGDILGVEWFRVGATDDTIYTTADFDDGYTAAAADNKGEMTEQAGGANNLRNYSTLVGKNGIYWVRVEFRDGLGTTRYQVKSIVIDNIYDRVTISIRGAVSETSPVRYLYGSDSAYEPLADDYGIPYDFDGITVLESPSLGFYQAVIENKRQYEYYWNPTVNGTSTPITLTLDASFLTNSLCDDGDAGNYTLVYEKIIGMWTDVAVKFVDRNGNPVTVDGQTGGTVSVPVDASGDCVDFLSAGAWYEPPRDLVYSPMAYVVGTSFNVNELVLCQDFSQFDPKIDNILNTNPTIHIVYGQDLINVTELYETEDGLINWASTQTVMEPNKNEDYNGSPRDIPGYIAVGYKIEYVDGYGEWFFNYDEYADLGMQPTTSQQGMVNAYIPSAAIVGDFTVTYYYKPSTGTGIPLDEAALIDVNWIGYYLNGSDAMLRHDSYYTRLGYPITFTNDSTPSGDPAHVWPATVTAKWIFDNTRPAALGGNEKQTIMPTDDMEISFFYDYDTLGEGVPDKNQYVTERYIFADDGTDLRLSYNYDVLKGDSYTRNAPIIDGYVAYGYRIDGGELVVFDHGQPKTVSFTTTGYTHEVTYVYKTAAAPVIVKWEGTTYGGIPLDLGSMVINGYVGELVTVLPGDSPVAIDSGWQLDIATSDVPDPIVLDTQMHIYTYYYNENALFATITVEGSSTDNKINYSYEQMKRLDGGTLTVTAWSLPNYRMAGYTVYDTYNNLLASGTGSSVVLDLSRGSQKVSFTYVCTITTVIINAVNADDHDEVLFTQTITDAIIGEKFSAVAPYIDDTWVLAGDILQIITVQEGTNVVTFEYDKATGNVIVLLKEDDTNGRIIKVMSETVAQGSATEIAIPDLDSYYYTAISSGPDTVDYSGSNPVPAIIEYYYEKQMMDVQIRAIDKETSEVLETVSYPAAARIGETYRAVALPVGHYTIAEENYKNVYADPSAGSTLVVDFKYVADEIGNITVRYYYLDESDQKVLLSKYTGNAIVESKFTAMASLFDGFTLDDANEKEIIVSDDDDENIIEFKYTDVRLTVTTKTQLGSSAATVYGTPEKVPSGTTMTVTAPHMNGYVVKGYQINSEQEMTTGTLISVPLTVTADTMVTFSYVQVEDVLDEYTSAITVKGLEGAMTHYEYTLTMAQNAASFDVTANTLTGLKVTGYTVYKKDNTEISSGTSGMVTVDPADGSQTVVFTYESNMTTVTIRALYSGTTTPVETFTPVLVPAEVGKQFSYTEPSITGFTYVSASPADGVIDSVPNGGTGEIIFYYTKNTASGGLMIKAVEQDGGAELCTVYRSINNDQTFTPTEANDPKSVENPAALATYELVSFAPTETLTYDGVHDITVTYTYKKIQRNVIVEAWDAYTFAKIGEMSSVAKDVGAAYTISAPTPAEIPELANYTLLNSNTQSVYVDNSSTDAVKVTFYYKPNAPGSIKVVAYWMDGEVEREIQSNTTTHAAGIPVTVTAPMLHGWTLAAEAPDHTSPRTVTPTVSATTEVKFRYIKDVSTITIKLMSGTMDITSQVSAGYATSIEVSKGDAYTVYAPYINGYVLADNEASVKEVTSIQTAAGDVEVIFTYETIEEAVNANYVSITIRGVSGTVELYSYAKRVEKSDTALTLIDGLDVFAIPGYVLDVNQAHNVVPDVDRTMTFHYTSTAGMVKISLVDDATGAPVGAGSFNVAAEIGSPFTYLATNVDGYRLVSASSIGSVVSVAGDGSSEIVFRYAKIQSKVTVVCKEDDTSGKIICVVEIANPVVGTDTSVATPDLTNEYYTAIQDSVIYSFNGTDVVEVEAYYEKELIDIDVVAIDDATNLELGRDTLIGQRKGEVISVTAPMVADYVVIGASTRLVVADGTGVAFRYKNTSASGVTVQIYSGSKTGEMLQSYIIPAMTGETVTVNPDGEISIAGYLYNSSHTDNKLSATAGDGTDIIVIMTDNRLTLTVSNNINSDIITEKVVSGSERVVYPPFIEGYIPVSYQINSGSAQTIGTGFTGVDLTGANKITVHTEIVFNYETYEDVVNAKYVDITIKGVTGAARLYSYTMRVAASNTAITLTQPEDVFHVPGYVLSPGQDAKFSVTPDADKTVTFNYDTLATMVRIRMTDETNGAAVAESFVVAAMMGEAFSYTAPHVPGYYLTSASSIGTVNPVLANGASELTFTYKQITSKVTIVCKEDDTNGAILKIVEVSSPTIGTYNYNVPSLTADYYTPNAAMVEITYDGTNTVSVEAYYTKNIVSVTVNKVDENNNPVEMAGTVSARAGEAVTIGAPDVSGYILVSGNTRTVLAETGASVTFVYREIVSGEVTVKAVAEDGTLLESYTMTATLTGNADTDKITVNALELLGWVLSGGQPGSQTIDPNTVREVVFKYAEDTVSVLIKSVDADNESNVLGTRMIMVARGAAYTAYAPHISGYVLAAGESDSQSYGSVTAGTEMVFKYTAIENIVDEYTITIHVSGKTVSGDGLYSYEKDVARDSGNYTISADTIPNYVLTDVIIDSAPQGNASSNAIVTAKVDDIYVEFIYRGLAATVTIYMLEGGSGSEILQAFTVDAIEGQPFTYNAPDLTGTGSYYYLVEQQSDNPISESSIGRIDSVEGDGSSEIKFYYRQISSDIIFVAKENDANGRIIMIQEIQPDHWTSGETCQETAPDLGGDYYTYIGYDAGTGTTAGNDDIVEFEYDPTNPPQIIEVYYEKQTMNIPITAKESDTNGTILDTQSYNGARMGEAAYIDAPDVSGYTLSDLSIKGVLAAEDAEVEFYYIAKATTGSLTIKITASSTGSVLAGADVTVKNSSGTMVAQTQTDSNGFIELTDLAFDAYTITVSCSGYNSGMATKEITAARPNAFVLIALGTTTSGGGGGGGGGGYTTAKLIVQGIDAETGELIYNQSLTVIVGTTETVTAPVITGYELTNDMVSPQSIKIIGGENKVVFNYSSEDNAMIELIEDNHIVYINGRGGSMVSPDSNMTRAEAAQMFYNLLVDKTKGGINVSFSDVQSDGWYYTAITVLASKGVINGYPDGTYKPDGNITRAEFAAMASRFYSLMDGEVTFSDVSSDHWAYSYIANAAARGWVNGYPDGTFRPDQNITRAEVIKITNAALGRVADKNYIDSTEGINKFIDLDKSHWAYYEIMEATNAHNFSMDNGSETWIGQ